MEKGELIMRRFLSLLAVLFIAGILNCGEDPLNPRTSSLPGWPLEVGNWWEYDRLTWDGESTVTERLRVSVTKTQRVLGNHTAYLMKEEPDGEELWIVEIDGELRGYSDTPTENQPYWIYLKTPLEIGNTWRFYSEPVNGVHLTAEIRSPGSTIEVPAGIFKDCVHVHVDPYYESFYCPNVGLIKASNSYQGLPSVLDQLTQYHVK